MPLRGCPKGDRALLDSFARWWDQTRARIVNGSQEGVRDEAQGQHSKGLDLVDQARREWLAARALFESVSDPELVDHAIHRMVAAERRHMFLLKEARRSGLSEEDLRQLVTGPPGSFPT